MTHGGTGTGAAPGIDVLCCGLATLDLIQYVARIPGADEKVVADEATLDAGGPATNAARTAAALSSATCLVTVLGMGSTAASIRERLEAEAVAVVDAMPGLRDWSPPVSAITVDRAGRRSVASANAGSAPAPASTPELPSARVVLVDGHHLELAVAVATSARGGGAVVVLDGGSWKPGLERLLPAGGRGRGVG